MLPGALNCVLEVGSIVFPGALNSSSQLPAALDSRECPRFEKHMFSCRSRAILRIHDLGACPFRTYRVDHFTSNKHFNHTAIDGVIMG
jgi:hypothetical protein